MRGDIPNDGQGTELSVQHHQRPGELRSACLTLLRQADKLLVPHFGFFLEFGHDLRPESRVLPQIQLQWSSSQRLVVRITRKPCEAVVDLQKLASRDRADPDGVGAGTERRREHAFGMAQGLFRQKEFFCNAALFLIGQHKTRSGKYERSGHRYPCDGALFRSDAVAHEENQQWYENRQRLRNKYRAKSGTLSLGERFFLTTPCRPDYGHEQIGHAPGDVGPRCSGTRCVGREKRDKFGSAGNEENCCHSAEESS